MAMAVLVIKRNYFRIWSDGGCVIWKYF